LIFIGIIGIAISVLLSYLLTIKIRKQIKQLSEATEAIKEGNFDVTVKMKGNDEFTQLSDTFNLMVGKLNKNQKLISDYSDFITLLNQNSTLKEISEIALNKIITTCNFSIGAIYLVESDEIKLLSTYGIGAEAYSNENKTILNQVIEKKNKMVLSFDNNIPSFKTGLLEIKLSHLILQPIIYSDKVVAILELVSQSPLSDESIDYLDKIQEQLAIGLINAKSILQLENLVVELQKLNEELKNSNQQISEQNEKLIRLSEILQIRTKELSTQKEKAEESTKLKSQFLARISHELKTPLNSIIGLTDLILSTSEISEHDKERLLVVQRSGKRLIDLINNLLDYSQMESGKFKPEFSDFLLGDFVDHIVFEMEPLAHQKNLKLCVNKNNLHDLTIYSDREKLYQVLVNIIGNAIKFTQEGFIEFNINKNDSNKIIFSVLDTGIGIADSEKEIIFEEFRQADGSYSRKFGGTGLGLAISKKILDMLGGKIWLESKVNMGSKFFVEIPIKNSVQISKPKENIKILLDDETIKENLILAVDDDPDSLFTLTEILNSFRLKNIVARSGLNV
jgi:signal transduction histidine kinase/HAMP domain-containing protein